MKKKFFSLIFGDNIHIAPEVKHIPAKEFSRLIDGKKVLEAIRVDAEKYRQHVAKECETTKENAYRDGYEEGFSQWAQQIAAMEQEKENVRKEMEQLIVPAALKGAQKILGRELTTSRESIVDIVANNLRAITQHTKITIHVAKSDFRIVDEQRDRLKALFENLDSFTVVPRDDIEPGGCIIETEGGIINAELPNLWALLESAFEQILREEK